MMLRLRLLTPAIRLLRSLLRGGERGQAIWWMILILNVFVIGAAIVIDSSIWYGHRRTFQKSADASALAGGQELFTRTSIGDMTSRATDAAIVWRDRNNSPPANFVNNTPQVVNDCWGMTSFDGLPDGVISDVSNTAPLLFIRAFDIAGFNIGAHAKVCLGSPQEADGLLPFGIPIITSPCFLNGVPLFGQTCDIAVRVPAGTSGEAQYMKLYDSSSTDPADWSRRCSDQNAQISNQDFEEQVARGARTWCAVTPPGGSCPDPGADVGHCVVSDTGNRSGPAIDGLQTRLLSEGECNDLFGPTFGTQGDHVDQWWEAFCVQGVGCGSDIQSITPGPNVTFIPRDCTAPRFVTLVLLDQFPQQGNCTGQAPCAIRGFAGFFIAGCWDDDNRNGERDPADPFDPWCRTRNNGGPLSNQGHIYMEGTFMQYVDLGGPGGPATPYGRMQIYLVE